ncbi:MAG: hypothetical protein ABIK27_00780 [Bacteroidota bacterium]
MENLKVALLLHFYQPWWQFPDVLHKIVDQCYRPILGLVNNLDGFCFTANINLSLLELLDNDFPDVVAGFRKAAEKGKIELMGSTAQHPILPLIPEFLQRAQIRTDKEEKENKFNIRQNCRGFYLPEMAFSGNIVGLMEELGYGWSVMDDEPFMAKYGYAPFDHIITLNSFKLYMRSHLWSHGKDGHPGIASGRLSFPDFKTMLDREIPSWTRNAPAYLIIATDAETFGHHHQGLIENFLEPMLTEWGNGGKITSIESLELSFPWRSVPDLIDGSWATSADDLRENNPYPLWNSRFNKYHSMLWELINIALRYFQYCEQDCLKMTSSCHWWWISGRSNWEPEFMKFGARKAIEIIRKHGTPNEVSAGEDLYKELSVLSG